MTTALYRYDYLKVIVTHPAGHFQPYYHAMRDAARGLVKDDLAWDRSHKVTPFHSMEPLWERTCVEVWGEAADLINKLPFHPWHEFVKRLDVRAILWDVEEDAVMYTGQRLQRNVSSLNVEVFSSKNASKRQGRDRGGKGFRIGSRKSDVCVVAYKRKGEPAAQEFRFQGQALANSLNQIADEFEGRELIVDLWATVKRDLQARGMRRMERAMNEAGIGVYWPLFDHLSAEEHEPLQMSLATYAKLADSVEHDAENWSEEEEAPHVAHDGYPSEPT
jgi:hypothetical protein